MGLGKEGPCKPVWEEVGALPPGSLGGCWVVPRAWVLLRHHQAARPPLTLFSLWAKAPSLHNSSWGLCSKILGLYDLTQDGETGLGQRGVKGELFEPWVSWGEGGEGLWGFPWFSLDFPQSLQAKTKVASPSWGPMRPKGPN